MLILIALSVLCGPTSLAVGNEGHIDTKFGNGGELPLPPNLGFLPYALKPLSDGRMILLDETGPKILLPSGQRDDSVGEAGVLTVVPPPGGSCAVGIVVRDGLGRLVGVGRCRFPDEPVREEYPQNHPGKLLVERWTPAGMLDRTFGGGDGMVVSDFGLPPAAPGLLPEPVAYQAAFDAHGRIVIAGNRAAGFAPIKTGLLQPTYEPFVARLTSDGEIDEAFGDSGVLGVPGIGRFAGMITDDQGGVLLSYLHTYDTTLLRIGADGAADAGFGEGGFRRLAHGSRLRLYPFGLLGKDPHGRVVFSAKVSGHKERHQKNGVALKRLNPDGSLDRTLGRNGVFTARFRRMLYSAAALDDEGRVLVAMAIRPRNPGPLRTAEIIALSLARLHPNGRVDRSFGQQGFLKIPFDPKRDISLDYLQVAGGVALIGKDRCDPGKHCHPVLFRVALDS